MGTLLGEPLPFSFSPPSSFASLFSGGQLVRKDFVAKKATSVSSFEEQSLLLEGFCCPGPSCSKLTV